MQILSSCWYCRLIWSWLNEKLVYFVQQSWNMKLSITQLHVLHWVINYLHSSKVKFLPCNLQIKCNTNRAFLNLLLKIKIMHSFAIGWFCHAPQCNDTICSRVCMERSIRQQHTSLTTQKLCNISMAHLQLCCFLFLRFEFFQWFVSHLAYFIWFKILQYHYSLRPSIYTSLHLLFEMDKYFHFFKRGDFGIEETKDIFLTAAIGTTQKKFFLLNHTVAPWRCKTLFSMSGSQ